MIEWAKVHIDLLGDPKLMRAARKGAKGLVLTPWFIVFAKGAADDGRLSIGGEPAEPADFVSLIPGQTLRSITAALVSLEEIGVLVRDSRDQALRFTAWEIRQEQAPSDSKEARRERVRRHRERQRNTSSNASSNGAGNTGDVTGVTGGDETEERREESEEKRGDTASVDSSNQPAGRADDASARLDDDDPTDGQIMAAIRRVLYAPDSQPPDNWEEGREFSIMAHLRKLGHTGAQILAVVEGLGYLKRDGIVSWLDPTGKATLRVVYHSRSGVLDMWNLAQDAYYREGGWTQPKRSPAEKGRGYRNAAEQARRTAPRPISELIPKVAVADERPMLSEQTSSGRTIGGSFPEAAT